MSVFGFYFCLLWMWHFEPWTCKLQDCNQQVHRYFGVAGFGLVCIRMDSSMVAEHLQKQCISGANQKAKPHVWCASRYGRQSLVSIFKLLLRFAQCVSFCCEDGMGASWMGEGPQLTVALHAVRIQNAHTILRGVNKRVQAILPSKG